MSTGELWRIGDPDGGPRQFSTLWFTPAARGREPTLVVGEGNAAVDFPQVHPGPLDAVAGFHPATATVMFDGCTEAAAAWHALALDAVATHGPCPDLLVGLGERHGRAVLEPERRDRAPYPFPPSPIAGVARRVLALPPRHRAAGP